MLLDCVTTSSWRSTVVHFRRSLPLRALAAGLAVLLAACADSGITAPDGAAALDVAAARAKTVGSATLLACPGLNTERASAVIGAAGGTLAVGGQVMTVPAGAVPTPTLFTMAVPPGRYMELNISAAGEAHYAFARPVSITVDYSRCRGPEPTVALDAWHIDSATRELLQDMNGVDDRAARKVTFSTDHLSGYAIAF